MDLETENRIAAILLKEAAELRRKSQEEGALAYLHRPNVRGRPNSRFLTATVLGVQQANRAVEVSEMWKVRQKELELENRRKQRLADETSSSSKSRVSTSQRSSGSRCDGDSSPSGSKKREIQECDSREEEGLKDTELEVFLQSRVKRGRGSVGSRMDETGPYLPSCPDSGESGNPALGLMERYRNRGVIGPEKPVWLNSEDESFSDDKAKVSKKAKSSRHHHCKKDKSKKKFRDKEDRKRRKEKIVKRDK